MAQLSPWQQKQIDTNPEMYYLYLKTQGYSTAQANEMMQKKFNLRGDLDPNSTDNKPGMGEQIGQAAAGLAGSIGGTVAGNYATKIGGKIAASLGMGSATTAAGTAGAGTAGAAGASGASIAAPKILGASQIGAPYAATTGGGGLASVGSVALPVAAALATASNIYETGGKDIIRGKGKSDDWANQGFNMVLGPALPIALRLMGKRSLGRMITGGKSDAQEMRDMFRKDLRNEEIADKDWNVTLADGTKYNIGLDGKAKLKNIDGETERRMWDVDTSNPLAAKAIKLVDAKVREKYGNIKGVAPEQFTGMLVNAITSNAKTEQDLMANYEKVLGQTSFAGGTLPSEEGAAMQDFSRIRPEKGEMIRLSPGLYRSDRGRIVRGKTLRQALERAYNRS